MEIADLEIKRAAQLSITEICIGSVGHGLKIPLTGQLLSLNQLAFLLNAINRDKLPKASVFEISSLAAVLKSFSPAGQKIGPMLSIATQGFLFWLSLSVLGLNLIGQVIGAVLLSLWAFVQPLLTLLMIYGPDFFKLVEFYQKRISEDYSFIAVSLVYAVLGFLILKLTAAVALVIYSFNTKKKIVLINNAKFSRLSSVMSETALQPANGSALQAALRDLLKPLFLFSFILMLVFIWQLNGNFTEKIWMSLRPLATAFVLFYLLRSPWVSARLLQLSNRSARFARVYQKSKKVLDFVAERTAGSSEVSARRKFE